MIKKDEYVDCQTYQIKVGKHHLIAEWQVKVKNSLECEQHWEVHSEREFSVEELAEEVAKQLDLFTESVRVVCTPVGEGGWRPVMGAYSLMQLWVPTSILISQLVRQIHKRGFIKHTTAPIDQRLVIHGHHEPPEIWRLRDDRMRELGLVRLSGEEQIGLMKTGLVRPEGGAIPSTPTDHLMAGLVHAISQCPIHSGVVPERELERLSRQAKAVREVFVGPDDQVTQERASEIADVDARTIRRWIDVKNLPCYGPERRVSEAELRALLPVLKRRRKRVKDASRKPRKKRT